MSTKQKYDIGEQSLIFPNPVYLISGASVVGKKEGEGPLGSAFDMICDDDKFGEDTWEMAESTLQKEALSLAMGKAGLKPEDIRYLFAGDLLGQNIATSFGLMDYEIPLFGLYGACSTAGESLSLASMCVGAGYAKTVAALTSSHFASAEKQFRFPLEYANQRPVSATWTVTGSGAFLLSGKKGDIRITGVTTGKIIDMGIKDSMNMGAAMAPAAADVIAQNLEDFGRKPTDYDKIITGDVHEDCGILIYDRDKQGTGSGGSGCGCSAVTLCAHYLPMLKGGSLKRILFVPTGALLSTVSFNEGQNVPGIAHAVVLEYAGEES